MAGEMIIWNGVGGESPSAGPRAARAHESLEELARLALAVGGRQGLARWTAGAPDRAEGPQAGRRDMAGTRVAHVHGERHDLWWEFTLEASFRWQAQLHQMRPELYQQRRSRLTRALGLEELLSREVASLTHTTRALADLAVALLPRPALLLWEEPFYLLGQTDAARAVRLVRQLNADGMALVAVATEPPLLADLAEAAAAPLLPLAR